MPTADHRLVVAGSHLTTRTARRRLTASWHDDPVLAGRHADDILTLLTDAAHPDNPTVFRALIERSQHGDQDAALLVLATLRPGIWRIVHAYHRSRPGAFDDALAHTAIVIAGIDPDLTHLRARIIGRVRVALTRPMRRRNLELLTLDTIEPAGSGDVDPVGAQVEARLVLQHIGRLTRDGTINPDAWCALVATRINGQHHADVNPDVPPHHLRQTTSRLARRLQLLVA